jgi:RNA polymerase sigma factor (sigma-70 family)
VVHAKKGVAPAPPEPRTGQQLAPARPSAEEEFTVFFNENYQPLLSFATFWGKNPHDADDALARVMIDIGQNWGKIQNPFAYARKAVTRAILNVRRDRSDGRYVPVPADQLPNHTYDNFEVDRLEGQEWVDGLLDKLPPTQREVLRLFLDGLGMGEIAAELRKNESAIRQNLKLARDRLRPFVAEYDRTRPCPSGEQTTREDNR